MCSVDKVAVYCSNWPLPHAGTVALENIEWSVVDEYEWRINPDGLARLEPEVRAKLDLRLLARIANTDPNTLMKVRYMWCVHETN